ncbi:hypothetical protein ACFTSF_16030 [Kribbella sp. NPDC056951]|uniref:hypothetical protein n=1 Tax=Kribbella sp. NPDC056951 TaxID=3345978 RepID=UPI003636FBD5
MTFSLRRVFVAAPLVGLLMATGVVVPGAGEAEAVTCVRSSNEPDSVLGGIGYGYRNWPGGDAKVRVTYSITGTVKMIRVRKAQNGSSTSTTLLGTRGRKVTKTVSLNYQPRGDGTLWFEPRGDSSTTGRVIYSFCLYKG